MHKIVTKIGAAAASGALILSTFASSAFAAGWGGWNNSWMQQNQGGWWNKPQQQQYSNPHQNYNPWGNNQNMYPRMNTNVRVNTTINQTTNNYFENNVNLINSSSGGWSKHAQPAGGFNATVNITNTAYGNAFGGGH